MKTSDWTMRKYFGRRGNRSWWVFGHEKRDRFRSGNGLALSRCVCAHSETSIRAAAERRPPDSERSGKKT